MAPYIRLPFIIAICAIAVWGACGRLAAAGAPPQDIPPAERRMLPYAGDPPPCDHSFVVARIVRDFSDREAEYWMSGLAIEGFGDTREIGYRPDGLSFIPRRLCEARALLNDGSNRRVTYEIAEGQGFLGFGFGVNWRVDGLDRGRESSFGR